MAAVNDGCLEILQFAGLHSVALGVCATAIIKPDHTQRMQVIQPCNITRTGGQALPFTQDLPVEYCSAWSGCAAYCINILEAFSKNDPSGTLFVRAASCAKGFRYSVFHQGKASVWEVSNENFESEYCMCDGHVSFPSLLNHYQCIDI